MSVRRIALAAATVAALSACGGQVATTSTATTASNAIGTGAQAGREGASAEPTDMPSNSSTQKFGATVKYPGGVSLTVSKPKVFKPSDTAAAEKAAQYVAFEVTVVNGSDKPLEAGLINVTGQSGDAEASKVFDSGAGIGESPSTKLLPGRQAKWKEAFGINKPGDIVLEVSPLWDMSLDSTVFTP